jgi:hypothetical protein
MASNISDNKSKLIVKVRTIPANIEFEVYRNRHSMHQDQWGTEIIYLGTKYLSSDDYDHLVKFYEHVEAQLQLNHFDPDIFNKIMTKIHNKKDDIYEEYVLNYDKKTIYSSYLDNAYPMYD